MPVAFFASSNRRILSLIHILHALFGKERVVDAQFHAAHDGKAEFFHQIVDLVDRAGRAVFDGQNAIAAHPLVYRVKDRLECFKIHDAGQTKQFFAGSLGIGALHALAGHNCLSGHLRGRILQRRLHLPLQGGIPVHKLTLIGAGKVEKRVEKNAGCLLYTSGADSAFADARA